MAVLLRIVTIAVVAFFYTVFLVVLGGEFGILVGLGVFIATVAAVSFGVKSYLAKV